MHGNHGTGWHGSDCHYSCDRTVCCRAQAVWNMGAAVAGRQDVHGKLREVSCAANSNWLELVLEIRLVVYLKIRAKIQILWVFFFSSLYILSNYLLVICPCEDGEYLQWCCQVLHLISIDFGNSLLILEELFETEKWCYY